MDSVLPIISAPASQTKKVQKMVDYCRQLDGTELIVIPISQEEDDRYISAHPINTFHSLQGFTLHREAKHANGRPFFHLETDSIPLKPGWLKAISDDYYRQSKPYMLTADSHPPGDLIGGIGVYGPDTVTEIPNQFRCHSWDLWMLNNLRSKIAFSPLIQHKYAIYDPTGVDKVREISFPRDRNLIRPDAVIFHKDGRQTLMEPSRRLRFMHSGCIGDAVAALPAIRQAGGGDLIMTQHGNPRILRGERYEVLRPLLETCPYLNSVTWEEHPEDIDFDFTDFRKIYKSNLCIADLQAKWVGMDNLNMEPWLSVTPDPRGIGRVVIARSSRYQNEAFHWRRFLNIHGERILFVGLKEEHEAFQTQHGRLVEYCPITNLLEMAGIIAGSGMFCGNQSSPFWIACGLGVKIIQETASQNPDSIVPRSNIRYHVYGRDSLHFW